jgi:hypothetical protein
MIQVVAKGRRHARPYSLACVSAMFLSFFAGTAHGQFAPDEGPRQQPQFDPWQGGRNNKHLDELNDRLEEIRRRWTNALTDSPKVKKTVRAVNDAVDGMAIGIMICGVLVIALVGWFIFKQMRPRSYTRRYGGGSPLDDPRLRLLMADMAAEGKKNQAKAEQAAVGERLTSEAAATSIKS